MLALYGSDVCLIDATYKTTIYDMPLAMLCVPTNVGYFNIAAMLLCDETQDTITAGLRKIAEWNPDWNPKCFISDFNEAQISALESVFPGIYKLLL
jgi:hypothetical protein